MRGWLSSDDPGIIVFTLKYFPFPWLQASFGAYFLDQDVNFISLYSFKLLTTCKIYHKFGYMDQGVRPFYFQFIHGPGWLFFDGRGRCERVG